MSMPDEHVAHWSEPMPPFKLTISRRLIGEGAFIPPGYGVAYHCDDRHASVCYPVPFNVLIGLARRFHATLKHGVQGHRATEEAWWCGYCAGRQEAKP